MAVGNFRFTRGFIRAAQHLGFAGPGPGLSGQVVPTLDLAPLSGVQDIARQNVTISGNGYPRLFTVPEGEIWRLVWFNIYRDSGDFTISSLYIGDNDADSPVEIDPGDYTNEIIMPLDAFAAVMPHMWLYPGYIIGAHITNFVSTSFLVCELWRYKMDYRPESTT